MAHTPLENDPRDIDNPFAAPTVADGSSRGTPSAEDNEPDRFALELSRLFGAGGVFIAVGTVLLFAYWAWARMDFLERVGDSALHLFAEPATFLMFLVPFVLAIVLSWGGMKISGPRQRSRIRLTMVGLYIALVASALMVGLFLFSLMYLFSLFLSWT